MAWCCQAAGHYLNQCWPISMSCSITRPQWVALSYLKQKKIIILRFKLLNCVSKSSIDNNWALVQVMARCQTGNKSLAEQMMTIINDASLGHNELTHWGWVTHTCIRKFTIIGSNDGLPPGRRQSIIWINPGIFLIRPLGTNVCEILIKIYTFSFKKMHLKMLSGEWQPSCLGLNVLMDWHLSNVVDVKEPVLLPFSPEVHFHNMD